MSLLMKNDFGFRHLHLMMLPRSERTLTIGEEFMLSDNFTDSTDLLDRNVKDFIASSYPFKIAFTMVLFCKRGSMRLRMNLEDYTLEENDILVVLPDSLGECLEIGRDCQVAVMAFSESYFGMETHFESAMQIRKRLARQRKFHVSDREMEEALLLYGLMRDKIGRPGYKLLREAVMGYLQVFFCNGYQIMAETAGGELPGRQSRQKQLYDRFMYEVQRHYGRERGIAFYADLLCVTPKYLSQVVRRVSGRYAGEWIRDYVILEAKALLKSGEYTVQQVGDRLNFPNPSFFGKYFKAAVGCSPRKYQAG